MVDYFSPDTVTAEMPQSRVTGGDVARSASYVPAGLEALGQGLGDLNVPIAEQAGKDAAAKAVTLDANGNVQVATPANSFILGKAGDAYAGAVQAGTLANGQTAMRQDVADIRQKAQGDPNAFRTAWDAHLQKIEAQVGQTPYGAAMLQEGRALGVQHYTSMVDQKAAVDVQESKQALLSNIEATKNTMAALAQQGGTETPEFKAKSGQLDGMYSELASNPLFKMDAQVVQNERDAVTSQMAGAAIVGHMDKVFSTQGAVAAAKDLHDQLANPSLNLSEAERSRFIAQGEARIGYLTGQNKAAVDANNETTSRMLEAAARGDKFSEADWQQAHDTAISLGDTESAQKIAAAHQIYGFQQATSGLSPTQQARAQGVNVGGPGAAGLSAEAQAMQFFQSKGWTPAQAAGIVGNLVHESGGRLNPGAVNPGDGADGSSSIGIGQWNAQRGAALKAFAAAQGKPATDYGTQLAFVQHELETTEAGAAARLKGATTPQEAAAAFALGYERPQGFQTGDIGQVAGGQNRVYQATRIAGGNLSAAGVPSVNGRPFTDAEARANPFLFSTWVQKVAADQGNQTRAATTLGGSIERSLENGIVPAPTVVANYAQLTEGKAEFAAQREKIVSTIAGHAVADVALGLPPGAGQAYMDQIKAEAQGGSIHQGNVAREAQDAYTKGRTAMKADPGGFAAARGWVPQAPQPLDFTNPASLDTAMAQRNAVATAINVRERVSDTSPFSPAEVDQVKSVVASGTLGQKTALLGSMARNLSAPAYQAALKQLVEAPETQAMAVAGNVMQDSPDAARGILQGQALLASEKRLAPDAKDAESAFMKSFPATDFPSPGQRSAYMKAATAYYASLSASANDVSQKLDQSRWDASIKAVTGGVINFRGSNVQAPWYGATDGQMQAAIQSLSPADLQGAITGDGTPFPPAALQTRNLGTSGAWRLQSAGDGKYLIFSGGDANRRYVQRDLLDARDPGGPFVLDLSGRRGIPESSMPQVMPPPSIQFPQPGRAGRVPPYDPGAKAMPQLAPGMGF